MHSAFLLVPKVNNPLHQSTHLLLDASLPCQTYCLQIQVNVRFPTVTAFGIRLNDDLAVMSSRLSGNPEGQLVPQGPAFIWNITHTGTQMYTFIVNTTGLTTGTGPNSMPDLSDVCAQGIQIADDRGKLIWQQPSTASSCV